MLQKHVEVHSLNPPQTVLTYLIFKQMVKGGRQITYVPLFISDV